MSTEIPEHELPKWAKELAALFERRRPPSYVKVLSLPPLVPHHDLDKEYEFEVSGGLVSSLAKDYVMHSETALRAISECTPDSCAALGRALRPQDAQRQVAQPRALRTYFKYQGFHRGEPDGYMRKRYYKDFSDVGWRYTVHLEPGLQVGSYEGDQEQSIAMLSFSHGHRKEDAALRDVPTPRPPRRRTPPHARAFRPSRALCAHARA